MNELDRGLIVDSLRGVLDFEFTPEGVIPRRLPLWARVRSPEKGLEWAAAECSGVRLEFETEASWVEVEFSVVVVDIPIAPNDPAIFQVTVDGHEVLRVEQRETGLRHVASPPDFPVTVAAPAKIRAELGTSTGEPRRVTFWLPPNGDVTIRAVGADSDVRPAPKSSSRGWIHYGSSISHSAQSDPLRVWPVEVASALDLNLTSLGLSGNAVLDPSVARVIRDSSPELVSLKVGINIVNSAGFSTRTFGPAFDVFLDTIREGNPAVPILVVTALACPIHEDQAGPTDFDFAAKAFVPRGRLGSDPLPFGGGQLTLAETRAVIRGVVERRSREDPRLYLLDGLALFGIADADQLPDALHPSAEGNRRIAKRFVARPEVAAWLAAAPKGSL